MTLNEKSVAVVTGAGRGIGRGIALTLAQRGCRLALVDINEEGLAETKALAAHPYISLHHTDVGDRAAMEALTRDVLRHHKSVHVLINNAGVSVAAPFDVLDLDDFAWLMQVNFWGTVYGCAAFLPYLQNEKEARICNVLSSFALLGFPTKAPYCASKFAVRGFSQALQAELHNTSVGMTCVYPGPVATGIIEHGRAWDPVKQQHEAHFVAQHSLPVDTVARRIVKGIARNHRRVRIGNTTILIDLATRFAPRLTSTLLGKTQRRLPFV